MRRGGEERGGGEGGRRGGGGRGGGEGGGGGGRWKRGEGEGERRGLEEAVDESVIYSSSNFKLLVASNIHVHVHTLFGSIFLMRMFSGLRSLWMTR